VDPVLQRWNSVVMGCIDGVSEIIFVSILSMKQLTMQKFTVLRLEDGYRISETSAIQLSSLKTGFTLPRASLLQHYNYYYYLCYLSHLDFICTT
jgi:hypothetical protein